MRIVIECKDNSTIEGVLALKDESFVMIKMKRNTVGVYHWNHIKDVKRVFKGERQPINLEIFKKIRE
jgi:hypothetical protein